MRREKFPIISVLLLLVALGLRSTQYIVIDDRFFGFLLGVSTVNIFTYGHTKITEIFGEGDAE